jgi:hypothetical protein
MRDGAAALSLARNEHAHRLKPTKWMSQSSPPKDKLSTNSGVSSRVKMHFRSDALLKDRKTAHAKL